MSADDIAKFKALLEALEAERKAQPCPSRGHCPTCGRGGHHAYPVYPVYPNPYYPYYPYGTTISAGSPLAVWSGDMSNISYTVS